MSSSELTMTDKQIWERNEQEGLSPTEDEEGRYGSEWWKII